MMRYFMANNATISPDNIDDPLFKTANCGFIYCSELTPVTPDGPIRLINEISPGNDMIIRIECLLDHYIEMSEDFYRFLFVCEYNSNNDHMSMLATKIKEFLLHHPISFKNQHYTFLKHRDRSPW